MLRALCWLSLVGILVIMQNAPAHAEKVPTGIKEECDPGNDCENNFVCNSSSKCFCRTKMIFNGTCLVHRHIKNRTESTVSFALHIQKQVVLNYRLSTSQTADIQGNGTEKVSVSFSQLKPGQKVWVHLIFFNVTFTEDSKKLQYNETTFSSPEEPKGLQTVSSNPGKISFEWKQKGMCNHTVCKLCRGQKSEDLCVSLTGPTCDVNGTKDQLMGCDFTLQQDVKYYVIAEVHNGDGFVASGKVGVDYYFFSKPVLNATVAGLESRSVNISMKASCVSLRSDVAFVLVNVSHSSESPRCLVYRSSTTCSQQSKPSVLDKCEEQQHIDTDVCEGGEERDFILPVTSLTPSTTYTLHLMPWYCNYSYGNENNSFVLSASTDAPEPWNVTGVDMVSITHTNITVLWAMHGLDAEPVNFTMLIRDSVQTPAAVETSTAVCDTTPAPWSGKVLCEKPSNQTTDRKECTGKVPYAFWTYDVAIVVSTEKGTSSPHWTTAETAREAPEPVPFLNVAIKNISDQSSRCGQDVWRDYNEICVTWKEICPHQRRNLIRSYHYKLESSVERNISGQIDSELWANNKSDVHSMRKDWNETSYFRLLNVTIDINYTFCVKATTEPTKGDNRLYEGQESCTQVYVPPVKPIFPSQGSYIVQAKDIPKQNYWCSVTFTMPSTCFMIRSKFGDITDNGFIVFKGLWPTDDTHSNRHGKTFYRTKPPHLGSDHMSDCNANKTIVIVNKTCSDETDTKCNGPLEPGTSYSVYAFVCTRAACSTTLVVENISTAGPLVDLTVSIKNTSDVASRCGDEPWNDYSDVCVKWKETCPHQGGNFILNYQYRLATPDGVKTASQWFRHGGNATSIGSDWRHFKLVNVSTDTNYTFCMKAAVSEKNGDVPETCTQVYLPSLLPTFPSGNPYKVEAKDIPKQIQSRRVTFSMKSTCFMHRSPYGKVEDNGFIVSKGPFTKTAIDSRTMPSWSERKQHSYYKVQPSFLRSDHAPSCDTQRTIVIGNETCGQPTSRTGKYCDGPLDPGTTYSINAMVCTHAGCATTPLVNNISTPAVEARHGLPIYIIVLACIAPIILPALVFLVYLVARSRKTGRDKTSAMEMTSWSSKDLKKQPKQRGPKACDIVQVCPIPLSKLEKVIKKKEQHNNDRLHEEFKAIQKLSRTLPFENSILECNRHKNRFADIVAYDHSRVRLTSQDQEGSDYINANFIPGHNREAEYIAMQGPMSSTKDDMWRMVWEYRVPMIVMLTQTKERGRTMCEQYWTSTPGKVNEYGHITVTTVSTSSLDDYIITRFSLRHQQEDSETLQVLHLQYLVWPDMTADVSVESVVGFLRVTRHLLEDSARPLVVHCSAGVGRTGTFICLDYVMQFIQKKSMKDKLDIFGFILRMRENRCRMVQTPNQYIFIHQVARRLIEARRNPKSWKQGPYPFATIEVEAFVGDAQIALPPLVSESGNAQGSPRTLHITAVC